MSNFVSVEREPVVFHSLLIEYFRGFNSAISIPLDASAIVVSGANGRGKTSLFDAIQWLVMGRIERLEELRYRKEEHIVNIYAPPGSKAKVIGKLKLDSSSELVTVTRIGDSDSSVLEIQLNNGTIVGEKAEAWLRKGLGKSDLELEEDAFNREFLSAGLLQQDVVREFLSANPADRHQILSRMLGISAITEFITKLDESVKLTSGWIRELKTDLGKTRESVNEAELQIKEITTRIEAAPLLTGAIEKLRNKAGELDAGFLLEGYSDNIESSIEPFISHLKQCKQLLTRLVEWTDTSYLHFQKKPITVLEELLERSSDLEKQIESEKSSLEADRNTEAALLNKVRDIRTKTDNFRQIAALAIPLLTDQCPVCKQKIDPKHVKKHLESVIANQTDLLEAEQSHRRIQESISTREKSLLQLKANYDNTIAEKNAIEEWEIRSNSLFNELVRIEKSLGSIGYTVPTGDLASVGNWLPLLKDWVSENLDKLTSLEMIAENVLAAQSVSIEHRKLKRLEPELAHLRGQQTEKEKTLDKANRSLTDRRLLLQIAKEKEVEVVEEIFNELQPVVQDLFSRLAPHPTFRRLSISHELYYGRGTSIPRAIDPLYSLEVNPSIVFSSAQANVAAICYFLALAFSSSTTDFGFVLLDDPLQSMDDVNVLGLSDLCRFLRKAKQLIIATHEDRLSSLLLRKLTSRDEPFQTLELDFRSWNSQGPIIKEERIGLTPVEPVLADLS